jgi:hypothetical protein
MYGEGKRRGGEGREGELLVSLKFYFRPCFSLLIIIAKYRPPYRLR